MNTFVEALTAFEKTHSWWPDATFMNLQNKVIKNFLDHEITNSEYIQELAMNGTEKTFCELITGFSVGAPKVLITFMACFLNELHRLETSGVSISHEIVGWYRKNHWKFPAFHHEKIDSTGSQEMSNQPHTQE